MMLPQQCCMPSPTCYNPCFAFPQQPMSTGYQKTPKAPVVYAPLPGMNLFWIYLFKFVNQQTQLTFVCSNSPIETLEKGLKYVQS